MALLPKFPPRVQESSSSSNEFSSIVTSDTSDFSYLTAGIYVGTAGNVVAISNNGTITTFLNVPAGMILPICARRVNTTGTTAANLVALY